MAFQINEFKNALPHGGARSNLFSVQIPNPNVDIDGHGDNTKAISLVAKSTTIPPSTIEPVDVPFFGRNFRLPGGRTFDDWSTMITNDEDFKVRDFFEQWSDQINSHSRNITNDVTTSGLGGVRGNGGYSVDAQVIQYGKDGNAVRKYVMIDAWPHTIGEISLDWAENGTIEEFEVTWAFSWWESVAMEELSARSLLTSPNIHTFRGA